MDNREKILHEKNETLRIFGMYLFLFFAVACVVLVIIKNEPFGAIATLCIIILLCPTILLVFFLGFAKKIIDTEYPKECTTTETQKSEHKECLTGQRLDIKSEIISSKTVRSGKDEFYR